MLDHRSTIDDRSSIPSRRSEARGPVPLFRPSGARHRSRAVARSAPRRRPPRGRPTRGKTHRRAPNAGRWHRLAGRQECLLLRSPVRGAGRARARVVRWPMRCRFQGRPTPRRRRAMRSPSSDRPPTARDVGRSRPRDRARPPTPSGTRPRRARAGPHRARPVAALCARSETAASAGLFREHGRCPTSRAPTTRPRPRPGHRRARAPGSAPRRTRSCTVGRSRRPRAR